jgi:hypothetical protein
MDSKIIPAHHRRGVYAARISTVKTATIAIVGSLPRKSTQGSFLFLKYLPHITIVAMLVAVLLVASRNAPAGQQAAHPETHMGQHL